MGAFLHWVVARRLLTLVGFGVILLGAFVPWPNLAIAAVVIILGAALLAVQIPIAMRDATEQLDGVDEPEEEWQSSSYASYQPPAQFQPEQYAKLEDYQQPQPASESAPAWQPSNIPSSAVPAATVTEQRVEPSRQAEPPAAASQPSAPSRPMYEPAPVWRPQNISPGGAPQHSPSRVMYEPAPVWKGQNVPQSQPDPKPEPKPEADAEVQAEPSTEPAYPEPGWKVGEPAPAWRPKNIPQR